MPKKFACLQVEILSLGDCLPTNEALPYLARLDLPVVQAAELTMLVSPAGAEAEVCSLPAAVACSCSATHSKLAWLEQVAAVVVLLSAGVLSGAANSGAALQC